MEARTANTRTRVAAVLILLLASSGPAFALDPHRAVTQYVQSTWDSRQGLPRNYVTASSRRADGYLWLGTQAGLVRFDGVRFTVYDDSNTPALRTHSIRVLRADPKGALWIGTDGGGVVRVADGQFTRFGEAEGVPHLVDPCADDRSRRTPLDRHGRGGLAVFDGARFTPIKDPALGSFTIRSIEEARDGTLWLGTGGGGVKLYADGRVTHWSGNSSCHRRSSGRSSTRATAASGSAPTPDSRTGRTARVETYTTRRGLPSNIISSLMEDRDGNLWVGTSGGLVRMTAGRARRADGARRPRQRLGARAARRSRRHRLGRHAGRRTRFARRRHVHQLHDARGLSPTRRTRCMRTARATCGSAPRAAG